MPEQDFLTRCFADHPWHSFGVLYNFQPHQFAFTDRKGLESCKRVTIDYETTVQIVHFSALSKLWHWFFGRKYRSLEEEVYFYFFCFGTGGGDFG